MYNFYTPPPAPFDSIEDKCIWIIQYLGNQEPGIICTVVSVLNDAFYHVLGGGRPVTKKQREIIEKIFDQTCDKFWFFFEEDQMRTHSDAISEWAH